MDENRKRDFREAFKYCFGCFPEEIKRFDFNIYKNTEALDIACEEANNKLTAKQKRALMDYLHNSGDITPWLSGAFSAEAGDYEWFCPKEKAKNIIAEATKVFDSSSLPLTIVARRAICPDHMTIRGIDFRPYCNGNANPIELAGKIYREKSFPFFSAFLDSFNVRLWRHLERTVLIYCDLPKGMKAIYTETIRNREEFRKEGEIVTQRGLSWRILKAWKKDGFLCIKAMPIIGSDTPERLSKDLEEIA